MTLSIHMLAEAIASGLGDDFAHAHVDKPEWVATRGEKGGRFRDVNEPRQSDYLDAARAVLAALDAAGWAVVPKEATEDMVAGAGKGAIFEHRMAKLWRRGLLANWSAMIQSAPKIGDA